MAEILIEKVTKSFGDKVAVDDTSLTVGDGEFLVLLGPSGCGKTTLLRAIAGLGMADGGRIAIGGRDVTYVAPGERNISMVFQSYAIFPHMTVRDNIGFGLKMKKVDQVEIDRRVDAAAGLLHIEDLLDRRPSDMSGGQRQRVAVARALAMEAEVLLMDEPLSNLDALLRLEMRAELKRLLAEVNATTVYVTHDQIEALSMGDRVAVMRDGVIQQIDDPTTVYESPANVFVGSFLGNPPMNFLTGRVEAADGPSSVSVTIGEHAVPVPDDTAEGLQRLIGGTVTIGVRAENIVTLDPDLIDEIDGVGEAEGGGSDPGTGDAIPARILVAEPLGAQNLLTVEVAGSRLKVSTHPSFRAEPDQTVWIRFRPEDIRWFDPATEQRL